MLPIARLRPRSRRWRSRCPAPPGPTLPNRPPGRLARDQLDDYGASRGVCARRERDRCAGTPVVPPRRWEGALPGARGGEPSIAATPTGSLRLPAPGRDGNRKSAFAGLRDSSRVGFSGGRTLAWGSLQAGAARGDLRFAVRAQPGGRRAVGPMVLRAHAACRAARTVSARHRNHRRPSGRARGAPPTGAAHAVRLRVVFSGGRRGRAEEHALVAHGTARRSPVARPRRPRAVDTRHELARQHWACGRQGR
jgi:hypothetical protein